MNTQARGEKLTNRNTMNVHTQFTLKYIYLPTPNWHTYWLVITQNIRGISEQEWIKNVIQLTRISLNFTLHNTQYTLMKIQIHKKSMTTHRNVSLKFFSLCEWSCGWEGSKAVVKWKFFKQKVFQLNTVFANIAPTYCFLGYSIEKNNFSLNCTPILIELPILRYWTGGNH